jgi:hypothetical protein
MYLIKRKGLKLIIIKLEKRKYVVRLDGQILSFYFE